jgi:hypothetical protein
MMFRRLPRRRKIALQAEIDKTAAIAYGRLALRKKGEVDHAEWRNKARERARVHFVEHGVALRMGVEGSQIQFIDHVLTTRFRVSKQPSALTLEALAVLENGCAARRRSSHVDDRYRGRLRLEKEILREQDQAEQIEPEQPDPAFD